MIEAAGEEFYLRVAKGVRDTHAKALLTQNGHEERGHAHRLVKAIAAESGETFVLPEPPRSQRSFANTAREESRHGERDAQAVRLIAANG